MLTIRLLIRKKKSQNQCLLGGISSLGDYFYTLSPKNTFLSTVSQLYLKPKQA